MQLAITNNLINGHSANTAQSFVGGISFTGFEDTSCVVLRGNNVTGTPCQPDRSVVGHHASTTISRRSDGTSDAGGGPEHRHATTANAAYVNSINDAGPVTIFGTIDLD